MATLKVFESAGVAHERDPRQFPYGYLTGGTEDHRNAVASFVNKEKPTFTGR